MILFPRHPFQDCIKHPDPFFQAEVDAAKAAGLKTHFIDINDKRSFCHSDVPCLYRGWIVTPAGYRDMFMQEPKLIVDPEQYNNSYNFPQWYEQIHRSSASISTPKSIWFPGTADILLGRISELWKLPDASYKGIESLGGGPIIIKDWCKGRKHEWFNACFIPDSSHNENSIRVIGNFLNAQGSGLAGGLVCRSYVRLKSLGAEHPKSHIPLFNEHRFFVFKGQIFYSAPYWDSGFYGNVTWPRKGVIVDLVHDIKSNFFALDVAEMEDGGWTVIEVNDGGTSGIPDGGNVKDFYNALAEVL